ncbi:RRP15-like protein [Liolophura sinensis]|uniref:RRP15-like protein n=1 Tax=Liolophura sinensis TaxID=3198878 RepID=UPI0031588BBB
MSDSESELGWESDEMEIGGDLSGDTEDEEDGEENTEAMENKHGNKGDNSGCGLANAMAKILNNKVPRNTPTILAKGMTEREIQKKKKESSETNQEEATVATAEKKKLWEEMARVKPNPLEKDRERRLQKIATRGVVQLFNAVKKQQKSVEEKLSAVGSSERKRSKVLESVTKGAFLDLLRGTRVNVSKDGAVKSRKPQQTPPEDTAEEGKWDILREDFMMGATLKDWDKEQSGDEGGSGVLGNEDGSDSDGDSV